MKKLTNTKQQYIEHNKALHAWLGLICCVLWHSANSTASKPK